MEGVHCKLYFDIDVINSGKSESNIQLVENLIDIVINDVKATYNIYSTRNDVLVLDSSTHLKFSNHVIFENIVFKNNQACLEYINSLAERRDLSKLMFLDSYSCLKPIYDVSVYSRNQNFRLMNSSKIGKSVILKPITQNSPCDEGDLFYRSLLCDKYLIVNTWNKNVQANSNHVVAPLVKKNKNHVDAPHVIKFPEIEKFVKSLIGNEGRIVKESVYENTCTKKEKFENICTV